MSEPRVPGSSPHRVTIQSGDTVSISTENGQLVSVEVTGADGATFEDFVRAFTEGEIANAEQLGRVDSARLTPSGHRVKRGVDQMAQVDRNEPSLRAKTAQRTQGPSTRATSLMGRALRLLPAAERDRYTEEWAADLAELTRHASRSAQLRWATGLLASALWLQATPGSHRRTSD